MSRKLIVTNALLTGNGDENLSDIYVENGLIDRILPSVFKPAAGSAADSAAGSIEIIDAGGRPVITGMIDPHVHMRAPGMEQKEDWLSGSRAAVAGGVTTVIDMPNTKPATETPQVLELKRAAASIADRAAAEPASDGPVPRRLFWAGCSPESLPVLPEMLSESDVVGVKLFFSETSANSSCSDIDFISAVFRAAAAAGKPVAVHTELAAMMNPSDPRELSGLTPLQQHNVMRPAAAAVAGTALALELASVAGCRLYLCHLSVLAEFEMVRKHKEAYGRDSVIAELTPHHLLLNAAHAAPGGQPSWAKVNPPLRKESDRAAAEQALLDGTIDCIGSDHAPHLLSEKDMSRRSFHDCPSGFPGLETELGAVAGFLQSAAGDSVPVVSDSGKEHEAGWLESLQRLTNRRAAQVFGLENRNAIAPGKAADLVILDGPQTVNASVFRTKAKYSPFNGMELSVSVYKTIIGGQVG